MIDINNLRNEIVKCNDKQQLDNLRQQLDKFQQSIDTTTLFELKRIKELVDGLYKIIDNKQVQLSMKRFEFIGEPIPPNNPKRSIVKVEKNVSNLAATIELMNEKFDISDNRYVLITSSTNSIVTTIVSPPSIHMKNTTNSICKLTSKGPIFIHNVTNSILVLSCHQARLHNIKNSIIIINQVKNNRIIIEDCQDLIINQVEVDDFNYPTKETINPHYKIMSQAIQNEIIQRINNVDVQELSGIIRKCFSSVT